MQKFLSIAAVIAMATSAFAGAVISEDFNAGEFTSATITRPIMGTAPDRYINWNGVGDSLSGWEAMEDWGVIAGAEAMRVENWLGTINPNGNNFPGFFTADGNVGGYYQKYNDVPKTGFQTSTTLDASMGGARDASGNALAFALVYDAECAWIHGSRGAYTRVNATVTLDGVATNAHSPAFYVAANVNDAAALAAAGGIDVTSLPRATVLNTDDSVVGLTTDGAAIRGISSGVIEQTVADGAAISVKVLNGRTSNQGISSWQYIAAAADNVKVVALEAGDTNGDLEFNGDDIVNLNAGAKFGAGTATWAEGDFTGDDAFNGDDVVAMNAIGNFMAGPYAATTVGADGDGNISFVYDADTGELVIDSDGALLNGFQIKSEMGLLTGAAVLPAALFTVNTTNELNGGIGATYADGTSLGLALPAGMPEAALLDDLTIVATIQGTPGTFDGDLIYVPEPATLTMLALGGLAAVIRRRK